ncbi:hypothetical protein MAXJ12_22256 [Mesorhizobium alhagi CCNWXJ12-2]|uniref:Uncharacterized protein n=1 Tax=Mesorhizobium alhagi CCNWXJ12-2 TaxID=1107882 RepID=H0HW91_9HYPH|nr:hypothetical protein MAXJ12_22256 [Mesorhizobium alhagi CCNWXJ12-2]
MLVQSRRGVVVPAVFLDVGVHVAANTATKSVAITFGLVAGCD